MYSTVVTCGLEPREAYEEPHNRNGGEEEARVCTGADTAHIVTVAWAVRSASVGRAVVLCHRTFRYPVIPHVCTMRSQQ